MRSSTQTTTFQSSFQGQFQRLAPQPNFGRRKHSPFDASRQIAPRTIGERRATGGQGSISSSSRSNTTAPAFLDQIEENLYLADLENVKLVLSPNYAAPGRPKIKYVLSILSDASEAPHLEDQTRKSNFVLKLIKVRDSCDTNIIHHLPDACQFIRQSLANHDGGVLVHCRKGVSRSGAVVVAYCMMARGLSYRQGLELVRDKRVKVLPNAGFAEQLEQWAILNYSLTTENGTEKEEYNSWMAERRFGTLI